jgi:hypothetical protein
MSRSLHQAVAVRHRFAPITLAALAVASAVACGASSGTAPSPSSNVTGTSGTIIDPCTVPDAGARPGPAAGPAIVDAGSVPPVPGSAAPPGTGGVSEACRDSGGAVEGGGTGGGGSEQLPRAGGMGDTGSGGSSSGPSGSVAGSGPVSSLESDRPPAGY